MNTNIICNALIHILILILFFTFFINNKNDTNSVIFILVVTVVFVCYLLEFVRKPKLSDIVQNNNSNNRKNNENYKKENFSNNLTMIQNKFKSLKNKIEENKSVEHFSAPLDQKIGPYDGEIMNNNKSVHQLGTNYENENCGWRKPPCNVPLLTNMGFVAPTGKELNYERLNKPDKDGNPYQLDLNLPSVTGDKNDPKAMFMFAHNQSHPDCCPSTYSTSTGCVCLTKKQMEHLSKRGGNQKNDSYPGI